MLNDSNYAELSPSGCAFPYCAHHCVFCYRASFTALVAVAFGWLAYNSVNHDDAGHAAMTVYKFWAFTTAAVLVLLALFDFKKH